MGRWRCRSRVVESRNEAPTSIQPAHVTLKLVPSRNSSDVESLDAQQLATLACLAGNACWLGQSAPAERHRLPPRRESRPPGATRAKAASPDGPPAPPPSREGQAAREKDFGGGRDSSSRQTRPNVCRSCVRITSTRFHERNRHGPWCTGCFRACASFHGDSRADLGRVV